MSHQGVRDHARSIWNRYWRAGATCPRSACEIAPGILIGDAGPPFALARQRSFSVQTRHLVDMKMTLTSIHSYVISLFTIIDLARISGN